jgi:CRP/FNR family transcriptional regulator, cyclic AMP receptor protein
VDWDLLATLREDDRRSVLARCRGCRFARGEVIFWEGERGDSLHVVTEGTVAVRVSTPLGDIATLDVLGPGDTTGEQALLDRGSVRSATVLALEETETLQLLRSDFDALLADHPDVRTMLIRLLDSRLRRTSQELLEALYAGRVSGAIPITQEQLATMAGTTRPTVNRVLRRIQGNGLVRLERERITVTDPEGLADRSSRP